MRRWPRKKKTNKKKPSDVRWFFLPFARKVGGNSLEIEDENSCLKGGMKKRVRVKRHVKKKQKI